MSKVLKFNKRKENILFSLVKTLVIIVKNKINEKKFERQQAFQNKVYFLYEQAYQFYYAEHERRIGDAVDLPSFVYARQDALKSILNLIAEKRVEAAYTSRVNELKRLGRFVSGIDE
jgi:hypothetical protein